MPKSGIRGDRQLVAALRNISAGVPTRDIDAAAVRSLKPMLDGTKAALRANRNYVGKYPGMFPQPITPRKGGYVDQGMVVRKSRSRGSVRSYKLGPTKRARPLLHLLEYGTAPHFQPNFLGGFMHPGATPKPTLTPEYEFHKAGVVRTFGFEILELIERKAHNLGMRTSRGRRR